MKDLLSSIEDSLSTPDIVIQSLSDPEVQLSYRYFQDTPFGSKYICVVTKHSGGDPFIITAYLTDTVKRGQVLWQKEM
ncbi:MAG: hypothetical protein NTW14_12055 [bacterium]|nr:hypothetical protein [bacterium]